MRSSRTAPVSHPAKHRAEREEGITERRSLCATVLRNLACGSVERVSVDDGRAGRHDAVSIALASWSDDEVVTALGGSDRLGAGIGGSTMRIHVLGVPVFVKLVALTDLERQTRHMRSTANLFDLPVWYQYGVGSAGFGAWREVAAHQLTTGWVLEGSCGSFPMLHHWRVLSNPLRVSAADGPSEDIERVVRFWNDSQAVRRRLRALAQASATVVLFLEHVPLTVHQWLTAKLAAGGEVAGAACALVEGQLLAAVRCMGSNGLYHFDAHFHNVLTDGHRIYVSDFGLAASQWFELTPTERRFLDHTADHDLAYVVTQLVNTVVTALVAPDGPAARNAYLRRCAAEGATPCLLAPLEQVVRRYAPVAVVVNDFYWRLHDGHPTTLYPAEEIARALGTASLRP